MSPDKKVSCLLCSAESFLFALFRQIEYYRCTNCLSVFMAPAFHPSPDREKERYRKHNNDINDPGYREFVSPLVDEVIKNFGRQSRGLDFGAGEGPVASTILRDHGYHVELYDPFFWNDPGKLNSKYDYIICCEVIEHFHKPDREFELLRSLLKPGGSLLCMTWIFTENMDFQKWHYKDDETHVIFYHQKSLEWIKSRYIFDLLEIIGRVIHLKAESTSER